MNELVTQPQGVLKFDQTNQQPAVEIVIPVLNEEKILAQRIGELSHYLAAEVPLKNCIVIADNGSTDMTPQIAKQLAATNPNVGYIRLAEKGRGRALKQVWLESSAEVLAYMDVDLSTRLDALAPLITSVYSGYAPIAIGSRLQPGSRVVRGIKREFISRAYNLLLRFALGARFKDAQCGFKAISKDAARELLPLIEDNEWFFDTELLIQAQRAGQRIIEIPVDWVDDPDSRVNILDTVIKDLKGIWRLQKTRLKNQKSLNRINGKLNRYDDIDYVRRVNQIRTAA